jgi:hypothetical protein
MRDPLPPVEETGYTGVTQTFRMGVILPEKDSDCKGTVVPREEIRVPHEEPIRDDNLGDANSMMVPPTSGHLPEAYL